MDKTKVARAVRRKGHVMVVGDHYNDLAAFSDVSVSVYVGPGQSDTGSADAALQFAAASPETNLRKIEQIITPAAGTTRRIRQNQRISLAYNAIALLIASGVLSLVDDQLSLTPIMASLDMGLNSAFMLWNGSRTSVAHET